MSSTDHPDSTTASPSSSSSASASSILSPHFSPLIEIHTHPNDESLTSILSRNRFDSISELLSPFSSRIDKVTVRSSNYEARILPRFAVEFIPARARDSSSSQRTSHTTATTAAAAAAAAAATSGLNREQLDELYLDSLSSRLAAKLDTWLTTTPEFHVDSKSNLLKPRPAAEDDEPRSATTTIDRNDEEHDQWRSMTNQQLSPWFFVMSDQIFQKRELNKVDTFNTPIACLLVITTSDPDPLNTLSSLWDSTSPTNLYTSTLPSTSPTEPQIRDHTASDPLRFILLLHDYGNGQGRDGLEDAKALHEIVRRTYGIHTGLLPIFGASSKAQKPATRARGIADLWKNQDPLAVPEGTAGIDRIVGLGVDEQGGEQAREQVEDKRDEITGELIEKGHDLSEQDLTMIKSFIRELVVQSIIPYIERIVVVGYEQYQASKKGIGGRLFSAGRKYFGAGAATGSGRNSPALNASGQPLGYNAQKEFYPYISQEAQSRRLADLLFVLGDYKLASTIYDSLSKDYKNDRAYKHYASACRMIGLSNLLSHPPNQPLNFNPDNFLEIALQTPSSRESSGTIDYEELKFVLYYYTAYLAIPDLRPAPKGLLRTAGQSDEFISALLLEQAALSDLRLNKKGNKRQFGFHMIMASKRFEKTGVKGLSRRCAKLAKAIYKPLSEIEDDRFKDDPKYKTLFNVAEDRRGGGWKDVDFNLTQGLARQAYSIGRSSEAIQHFLELISIGAGDDDWLDDFELAWQQLSEQEKMKPGGWKLPKRIWTVGKIWDRAMIEGNDASQIDADWVQLEQRLGLTDQKGSAKKNEVGAGETFYLELVATNPLNSPLAIGGLELSTSETSDSLEIEAPQEIELGPCEIRSIYVQMKAKDLGRIEFTRLSYRFNDLLPCSEEFEPKRKRLFATPDHQKSVVYSEDRSHLVVDVRSPIPALSIELDLLPEMLYAGEVRSTSVRITNIGQVGLIGLAVISNKPSFARFVSMIEADEVYPTHPSDGVTGGKTVSNRLQLDQPTTIPLGDGQRLEAGASIDLPLVLRGDSSGVHALKWLFAYRGEDSSELHITRATYSLEVSPSLEIRPLVRPSQSPSIAHILACEISNAHVPSDLVITQITSLSPRWAVSMLPDVAFDDHFGSIGWQQSMNMILAVRPAEVKTNEGKAEDGHAFAIKQLDLLLQGKDVTSGSPPDIPLHHSSIHASTSSTIDVTSSVLLPSIVRTHTNLRHSSLTAQFPTIDQALQPSLFPLFNPRSLDLVIFWSSPSLDVRGHHHLADIPFGAGSNVLKSVLETAELKAGGLYAESQRERSLLLASLRRSELGFEDNPIEVIVKTEDVLEHEFDLGPRMVPVTFHIRNLSPSNSFRYELVLAPSDSLSTTSIVYVGSLTQSGTIAPLHVGSFTTQLWLMRQGVYDIGGWKLSATTSLGQFWDVIGTRQEVRVKDLSSVRPPPPVLQRKMTGGGTTGVKIGSMGDPVAA